MAKSKGAESVLGAPETAAATHGALRQLAGFDLLQLVGEFRAMRASVLALWRRRQGDDQATRAIEEIARFNEGIDQALAESVERYSAGVEASRDMFLAVLGHDLRGPLSGIGQASRGQRPADHFRAPNATDEPHERSKTSLGLGLFIVREIVRGHGGEVTVQSSAEAGTAFTITLPRETGNALAQRAGSHRV